MGEERRIQAEEARRIERRAQAVRLINAGVSYGKAAEQLGVSASTVMRDVQLALREIMKEPVEDMIARQRAVMADIRRANYPQMLGGDTKAAAAIIKSLDHEARLFGLYAPARVNVGVNDEDFAVTAARLLNDMGDAIPAIAAAKNRESAGIVDGEVIEDGVPGLVPESNEPYTDENDDPDDWVM